MNGTGSDSFRDRLLALGLEESDAAAFVTRRHHSDFRLSEILDRLPRYPALSEYPNLAIYTAGSHARGDASSHSDIDLWFIHNDVNGHLVPGQSVKSIKVMSSVIEVIEEMSFPSPSNDGQYLTILSLSKILEQLGGPEDDYKNHFTARMLLILESVPLYGSDTYQNVISEIMDAYLRDYIDHARDFRPTFLVNDVLRFWKTLCLNYEHRRNKPEGASKSKQKIKNFKLGYSRLLTCFATVAALARYNNVTKQQLVEICTQRPIERLLTLSEEDRCVADKIKHVLISYAWFLRTTEMDSDALQSFFNSRQNSVDAFNRAKEFGDRMFELVQDVANRAGTLRYLVV